MAIPTTQGEFSYRLYKAVNVLDDMTETAILVEEFDRLRDKADTVASSLTTWDRITGGKTGQELDSAIDAYRAMISSDSKMDGITEGQRQGYQLVLSYLNESEFIDE